MRRAREGLGDGQRVRAVRLHAEVEGLGAALREPAVVRAGDGTDSVLEEAQLACEGGVVRGEDERAHDDVRVTVDVFCDAVQDDVGAEEQGGGVEWRKEGVVYEDEGVGWVGVG